MEGKIFNIQSYSIHDGPGVRTTVFVCGCPLRCLWCQNPESGTAEPKLFFLREKCVGCGACTSACPNGAVRVAEGKAVTDRVKCTACGACVPVCDYDAREIVGKVMTSDEVVARVLRDKLFLRDGGVTVSGGEPTAQPEFTAEILRKCRAAGLHTAIETCGFAEWERFKTALDETDLVLYDLKHMDSEQHRSGTGVGNEKILENARRIVRELHKPLAARVPTIPGFNDSEENMHALGRFVSGELDPSVRVHLLPYHRLGESKNERMERIAGFHAEPPSAEHMEHLREIVASYGLDAVIGG